MSTNQTNLVCDASTYANFSQWASYIAGILAGATNFLTQWSDTGQVVWTATVLTCTQVAVSGGNAVYSYSSYTGPTPRVGMSVTITGFATGGNNVTATITSLAGAGATGTFTVTATTQANETHAGSATTTANSVVPGAGSFVYEVYKSCDVDGQNPSSVTLSQVSVSGSTVTYTYSSYTGLAPAAGHNINVTGFTITGNNVSGAVILTSTGGASGTFTVALTTQANETHAGLSTKCFTPFFLKLEYGNQSFASNCPTLKLTFSESTNGAGTLNGTTGNMGGWQTSTVNYTPPSASVQYECDFSWAAGRFGAMLWRNGGNSCNTLFAFERSVDSTGAYTGAYVTLWTVGNPNNGTYAAQASLVFGVGVPPNGTPGNSITTTNGVGWTSRQPSYTGSTAFNNSIPFDTCTPVVGYFDQPCTQIGVVFAADVTDGVTFTATVYGSSRTYMPGKTGNFAHCSPVGPFDAAGAACMRYD